MSCRRFQVCSRCTATFLAFDAGEGVGAVEYSGDTLYTARVQGRGYRAYCGQENCISGGRASFRDLYGAVPDNADNSRKSETTMKLIDHVPHKEAISLKDQSAREIQNAPVLVKQ